MLILGAHMSIADGFAFAANTVGEAYKANAMQLFTKSPRSRRVKSINPEDAENFKQTVKKFDIKHVVAHSSYLLNFAKPISSIKWALNDILLDFERLHFIGGHGVVVHIGKCLELPREAAIKNVIENAKIVIEKSQKFGLDYILENTAGQGSEIGFRLDELAQIWKALKGFSPRLRSCLDTAHIFAAGYDISTIKGVKETLETYDQTVGLKTLSCIHFNDSKKPVESRVDRHENIGNGFIKIEGLKEIAKFAEKNSVPLILETPNENGISHLNDLGVIRSWF